jgi:hypothetical protein
MATSSAVSAGDLATADQYNNLRTDVLATHDHDGTDGSATISATTFDGTATVSGVQTHSATSIYQDAIDLLLGTGSDAGMRWSTGDASNHSFVIALGNSNQGVHITDVGAIATDWNIAATTHPNVYIHSNTTPATDYLRLGDHDGTTAYVDVVGGTTLAVEIDGATQASFTIAVLNLVSGNTYQINATDVLSATTLGTAVVTSSLTTVGALNGGSITSGFGSIDIGSSALSATGTITGPSGTWDSGGMDIAASDSYAVAGTNILADSSGTLTLSNVDALDATTEATIEAAIDTLANLTAASALVTVSALNSGSITTGFGTIDNGSSTITTTGDITGGGIHVTGDTAAGDNAALGYTSAEGLILTGQGSTNDITIKNDADADVLKVATGTTTITLPGALSVDDTTNSTNGATGSIHTDGGLGVALNLFVATDARVDGLATLDTVDINAGNIDGTAIGAASASTIVGTTIDATTDFTIGSLIITDSTLTTSGNLTLDTTSTAALVLDTTSHLRPASANGLDLGDATNTWSNFYLGAEIRIGTPSAIGAAVADAVRLGNTDIAGGDARFSIQAEAGAAIYLGNNELRFSGAATVTTTSGNIRLDNGSVVAVVLGTDSTFAPATANGLDLGGTTNTWSNVYLSGNIAQTGTRVTQSYHTNITSTNALTVDSWSESKENITAYTADALAIIDEIDVISFSHLLDRDPSGRVKLGVRAESVRESMALVEMDYGHDLGTGPALDTMGLTALNTKAIQELHEEIRSLKTQLGA